MNNFIKRQLLRVNGLQLIIALLVFIILIASSNEYIGFYKKMYTSSELEKVTTIEQLQAEFEREPKEPLSISTEKYVVTNWTIFKNSKPEAVYVLFPIEDKLVTALVPINYLKKNSANTELTFKGIVRVLTERHNIINSFRDVDIDKGKLNSVILPYFINCYGNYGFSHHPLSTLLISILPLLFVLWKVINILLPNTNGLVKKLSKYGELDTMEQSIVDELENKIKLKISRVTITESWFIEKRLLVVNIIPLDHVVWVHKQTTQHYHNFIPTGKTYQICLYTDVGVNYLITLPNESKVDELIAYFSNNSPWIICGFSEELKDIWTTNKQSIIENVKNNKQATIA